MAAARWLTRFDLACERWTNRLNPVLVKETRQALRSRSFFMAFLITLESSWCLSLVLAGIQGASLQSGESGPEFFRAYMGALLMPLCFVVPLGVFRSATAEFADQTFEVLAAAASGGLAPGSPRMEDDVEYAHTRHRPQAGRQADLSRHWFDRIRGPDNR